MLASIASAALLGIDAYQVIVEVDVAAGLPQWTVVGLAGGAVKESRERVMAALLNSGFSVPSRRITANLAPADMRKEGSAFDLPLALGLLVATGQLDADRVHGVVVVGELALDGSIRPVRGVLSIARRAAAEQCRALIVPPANTSEARLVSGMELGAPSSLSEAVDQLRRRRFVATAPPCVPVQPDAAIPDLKDVVGQRAARRALEIAAAGDHGALLMGPPGSGKTLLARCLPRLLPPLAEAEALEVIAIHSIAGCLRPEVVAQAERPFRAPHHTVSRAGLVGGGSGPRPGEVSLAHRGVLFLDEMLEFQRQTLDAMRQPMEDGHVSIVRAAGGIRYPAAFSLIGACKPCPCGYAGESSGRCICTPTDIIRYRARLSGPMADRIDLHVQVSAVPISAFSTTGMSERSADVRERVICARQRQTDRYSAFPSPTCNGRAPGHWLDRETPIDDEARRLLSQAADAGGLSARSYHRVLRVARTIADLDDSRVVGAPAIAEALRYRPS